MRLRMKAGNFPRVNIIGCNLPFEVTEDDWLVSIADAKTPPALTMLPFGRILYMHFDDVGDERERNAITDEQAKEIADFIKEARAQGKNLWANCHAGICRSGAVVSLAIDLGWEDAKHWNSPGRIPNHLVFNKVRKHFPELTYSWETQ